MVVDASDVAGIMAQVEPPYPGYRRTIKALQTYLELAKEYDGETASRRKGNDRTGRFLSGSPSLIRFLRLVGDLPADANVPEDETIYQGPLVDAVKSFQSRHGRDSDGRIRRANIGRPKRSAKAACAPDATDSRALALDARRLSKGAHRCEYPRISPSSLR